MIDALGNNPESCWNAMIDEYDYYRPTEFENHPRAFYPEPDSWILPDRLRTKDFSRSSLYAFHTVNQALNHANLEPQPNVGVFFSTTTGGNDLQFSMFKNWKLFPRKIINSMSDSLASQISLHYGFKGINTCIASACATGLVTIDYAMRFIDDYDYLIVGGSDIGVNGIDIPAFNILNALGTSSKPFDNSRDGFIMGEGAGCLILESEEKAKARGAKIYAYLHPIAHFSDAMDRTAPSGEGAVETMKKAAIVKPDVINAHGTSTPIGDEVEHRSIQSLFPDIPIYSCKGKIGHTFAAAGILETIYSILSMQNSIIPHTQGCTNPMDCVIIEPIQKEIKTTLNNSFGFGGRCCSQLIEVNNV
jgi:3-oxoacyl-[acyl-carrier-protein] synthase II